MKALICDKCGEVISDIETLKNTCTLTISTLKTGTYEVEHLCAKCENQFFDWLEGELHE